MDGEKKPAAKSMRETMPMTSEYVDRLRREMGHQYVNEMIRRAMAGEPGCFYAIENGRVLGTPFTSNDAAIAMWQSVAVTHGAKFACFIAPAPADATASAQGQS